MLLLIFKVGMQLRTPKSVIETHKIQKLDFFKCPPVRPWCNVELKTIPALVADMTGVQPILSGQRR